MFVATLYSYAISMACHNFRGAGARQRVSEQRKRKPGKRGMSLA